ncbi:hypothetical protein FA95DRAFT_1147840 [Auriscalpium vulgare]|uniref:Uncharacterized protein n=1 Tax=Auriscalpium vulgare TaxID=40419 RepID=A0ACB8RVW2_9AGAM|nr:hypothetical protein FA95DRAFT_1147840 [Auriscalpium vulgare]
MQTATHTESHAAPLTPASSGEKIDIQVDVQAALAHEHQYQDVPIGFRGERTPNGTATTPVSCTAPDVGRPQSPGHYRFTVTAPQESPRHGADSGSPVSYRQGSEDPDVTDDDDEGERWQGFYSRTLASVEGRNRIYGLPDGMTPSPDGSTFALPYGSSRTNSVESFATYHSGDFQNGYDSDQSMLDATGN